MTLLCDSGSWRRSTRCSSESTCVEVALLSDGLIGIRDAKQPAGGPHLAVNRLSWQTFVRGLKAGEFGGE